MNHELLNAILRAVPHESVALPEGPDFSRGERDYAESIMESVVANIGAAAESDYFKTSRTRFIAMVLLAKRHLSPGATILDVGNAPGFLALALHKCGFNIHGINLSDAWLEAYPNKDMVEMFKVRSCDVERESLPYADHSFDAILFTEVLEHIAIRRPSEILSEFKRVLRDSGMVLFSTPNVCNLSNVIALLKGSNVFWAPDIFYGSTDRHNREYTPDEVVQLFKESGFETIAFFGESDHANWRTGTQHEIYSYLATRPPSHPLLRNTTMAVFKVASPAARIDSHVAATDRPAELNLLQDQMAVIWGNPQFQDLLNQYSIKQTVTALEVGGGMGILSGLVAALSGARVCSTDVSDYNGAKTREHLCDVLARHAGLISERLYASRPNIDAAGELVRFTTCSALDLPFPDEMFDFAFSLNAFEHINEPARALAEIRRVLKPGGKAFIQFSPIFTADDGSHLYSQGLLDVPWSVLLYSQQEIAEQVAQRGGDAGRVGDILSSLNGLPAEYYREMFANSDFDVEFLAEFSGYVLPDANQSPEFNKAKALFSEKDLGVLGFKALLRKRTRCSTD